MEEIIDEIRTWLGDKTVLLEKLINHLRTQGRDEGEINYIIGSLTDYKFSVMSVNGVTYVSYKGDTVERLP